MGGSFNGYVKLPEGIIPIYWVVKSLIIIIINQQGFVMDESPGCVPDLRSPGDLAEEPADDLSSGARCRHRRQTWENHGKS